jgi:putative tryptophan/tyrosine transport system substrate-binding protein
MRMMRRREFIAGLATATGLASAAHGQPTDRVRRVAAFLLDDPTFDTFRSRLSELGWQPGRNILFDLRPVSGNDEQMRTAVAALLAGAPDVIYVGTNQALAAIKPLAGSVPIVFAGVGDPVGSGFVASLARPGGNVTGFESYQPSMGQKWLEVLKDAAPSLTRALVIMHPETAVHQQFWHSIEEGASRLRMEATAGGIHDAAEIEATISSFAAKPNGGVISLPHAITNVHVELIGAIELRHRLPNVSAGGPPIPS